MFLSDVFCSRYEQIDIEECKIEMNHAKILSRKKKLGFFPAQAVPRKQAEWKRESNRAPALL